MINEYVKEGVQELDDAKLPQLLELKYGGIPGAVKQLGSIAEIRETFVGFQGYMYKARK